MNLTVNGSTGISSVCTNGSGILVALTSGDQVGPTSTFEEYGWSSSGDTTFQLPTYVGASILFGGETHYGWFLLSYDPSGGFFGNITLYSMAYETVANQSISVGNIPEPSETAALAGLLAGNAVAFAARRRRAGKAA
jgi:hypothetical protein